MLCGMAMSYVPKVGRRAAGFALRMSSATTSTVGAPGTTEFRVFFQEGGKTISPWHDIPLKNGEFYNFINEIPK